MPYSSDRLLRLVQDDHTAEVAALEDSITAAAIGDAESALALLVETGLKAWTLAFGGPGQPAVAGDALRRILAAARAAVRRILGHLSTRAAAVLAARVGESVALGALQGAAFVTAAAGRRLRAPSATGASRALTEEAGRLAGLVAVRRDRALHLLRQAEVSRWPQLLAGLGTARAAVSTVRGHVAWVVGAGVAEGLDAVARAAGAVRLWVSEADACVRCLAYTGRTAQQGEAFPGGLSWDPRQRRAGVAPVSGPPLHAHCRCRTVPWSDRWQADGIPFPEALRREAQRAVGFGRGRPSESGAARVRAARELLRVVPDLLPAVEARARTAVRTGRFPAAA